ncbi:MAG: OmpA family protein [Bernardetiaceae bacterium]|nr:OmpA family protein [Bernardetiaceae bacterium]
MSNIKFLVCLIITIILCTINYSKAQDDFLITHFDKENTSLSQNFINDILIDKRENLWIATSAGLNCWNIASNTPENVLIPNEISQKSLSAMAIYGTEELYLASFAGEIYRYHIEEQSIQNTYTFNADIAQAPKITCLKVDKKDCLWIGTEAQGLWILPKGKHKVRRFVQSEFTRVFDMARDRNNDIFIGTEKGLFKVEYTQESVNIKAIKEVKTTVNSLVFDSENTMYFSLTDKLTSSFYKDKTPINSHATVHFQFRDMAVDIDDNIWVSAMSGLATYSHRGEWQLFTPENSMLSSRAVNKILCDSHNRIWVSTLGRGIFSISSKAQSNNDAFELDEQALLAGEAVDLRVQFARARALIINYQPIDAIADFLKRNENLKVRLSGHTDNVGNPQINLELSRERALAVQKELNKRGIHIERIEVKFFGGEIPIAPNSSEAGRKKNRRVEIQIIQD